MKIVFNTRIPDAPCAQFYKDAFSANRGEITFFDKENIGCYDIALFMTYDEDLCDLVEAKKRYPHLKIGLIDPRGSQVKSVLSYVDFLIVDSLEMKDFFAEFPIPIHLYAEYPNIKKQYKKHKNDAHKPIIIGYHGNSLHLAGMFPNITLALEELSKKYSLEFWAMYNIKQSGYCHLGLPKNMPVKHIQWIEENYFKYLSSADIGVTPNLMPIRNICKIKRKAILWRSFFNDTDDDYLTRYKMPSNPGRIIIFGQLGIPVVADFYPSALQVIKDEENGLLAYSCGGWYRSLEKLIIDAKLRQKLSDNMRQTITSDFGYDVQNKRLFAFFAHLLNMPEQSRYSSSHIINNIKISRDQRFLRGASKIWLERFSKRIKLVNRRLFNTKII